jgi:hypothetical protein
MLEKVGITVVLEFPEMGLLNQMRNYDGWEGLMIGHVRAFNNIYRTFNLNFDPDYRWNVSMWRPAEEIRPIYQEGISTTYVEAPAAEKLNKLLLDNLVAIPLYSGVDAWIVKNNTYPTGVGELGMAIEWKLSEIWKEP